MKTKNHYENFKVDDFVDDEKFRKWIFSPDSQNHLFWETFIKENPAKKETIQLARKIIRSIYVDQKPVDPEQYLSSLNILKERIVEKSKTTSRQIFLSWWSKVAAVLILPIIAISLYFYFSNQNYSQKVQTTQYIVPAGQKSNVILADGTNVWLNSDSKLTYYQGGGKKQRKVYLKGEAYFNVSKNKEKPFLVETKRYTIKVQGTKFNVRAFENSNVSETILEEGSVSILAGKNKEIKLKPNQRFYINQDNMYQVGNIEPEYYTCWKENVLKVDNEELQHLIVRLERWYGVSISVQDFEKVKNMRYTLTVKTESFREMLELMRYVTPFTYTINGEDVSINYNI